MFRLVLYPVLGALIGCIVGVVIAAKLFSNGSLGVWIIGGMTALCALISLFISRKLDQIDGGLQMHNPPLSPNGPFIDWKYVWEYLNISPFWISGLILVCVFLTFIYGWDHNVNLNYINVIFFWVFAIIGSAFIPYRRYSPPDAGRLFPSSGGSKPLVFGLTFMVVCILILLLMLGWIYSTFPWVNHIAG